MLILAAVAKTRQTKIYLEDSNWGESALEEKERSDSPAASKRPRRREKGLFYEIEVGG